ncbi:MAG TPA: type II toxin-antitoxin system PemK/MazF family toxin [Actinocrinis sp.]|nr:type II toxin-antitoxin system PemK/MazF family toxin [Actinocrinis sp.]
MSNTPVEMGEVFLVDFGEPVGHEQGCRRPAVVVSPRRFNKMMSGNAMVVPLTTKDHGKRSHIRLDHTAAGLDWPSLARCEDLRNVSQKRFSRFLGKVTADDLHVIRETVRILLDI